ncbi:PorP/SprF family type IX secretion system membrane protein [Geofilum sp. OHC36d9]|uniref:PorP/SprF family type IX secretion system membrane protein n=1 Tax=Geofilum sp. OHC36d9 TaxID=3458413 RepID=UPI0040348019
MTSVISISQDNITKGRLFPFVWIFSTIIERLTVKHRLFYFLSRVCLNSFIFFTFFGISSDLFAQYEPQFSQNMFNPLFVNAGYSGYSGRVNSVLINRTQWVGLEGAPKTTVVGADMALNLFRNRGGVGLVIMNDEVGLYKNLTMQASLAQRYDLEVGELGVGINMGFVNQVFDGTGVILRTASGGDYHQETDPAVTKEEMNGTAFDMGLGAWFSAPDYYIGASILHLFAPKPNFKEEFDVYIPRSFFLTGGYFFRLLDKPVEFQPSTFLKVSEGAWQLDLNVNVLFHKKYWGGLSYRIQDAIVLLGGVELAGGVRIGYSYDITTSKLAGAGSNGSHEIMVGYSFDLATTKREKRYKSVRFL